ncbi:PD-(D/E)XK motif protein [Arthrobacter rhombi]|uniref:PD-(D/E)XK motif protein n=1 Tax=Arthrobacter rhombi TaxID=71253 RepID=UPI000B357651|nr:PD-(D/E)XK motif protein [Arthrobacter rhombi]
MNTVAEPSHAIFEYLSTQVASNPGLTVRITEVETSKGPLLHAVDGSGYPSLLIPIDEPQPGPADWQNRTITFECRTIVSNSGPQDFVVLQCMDLRLLTQFSLLVDDILEAVVRMPDHASQIARETLERWRELLRDDRMPVLSDNQLVGLLGELKFLDEIGFLRGPGAMQAWRGPFGARHDFVFEDLSVEVKSTTVRETFPITVHGASQLVVPMSGRLLIRGYQFEASPSGESVPQVLQRLYERGLNRVAILSAVKNLGYDESDSGLYAGRRFELLTSRTVEVDEEFPRLTEETVPKWIMEAVTGLQYSINLFERPDVEGDPEMFRLTGARE